MARFGIFLAGISLPIHILILVGFLVVVWAIIWFTGKLRPHSGQLIVLAGILYMGFLFFALTYSFPVPRFGGGVVDAGTIPRVWFYALVPAVVLTVLQIIFGKTEQDPKWGNIRLVGIVLACLIASVSLYSLIGYYISSAIFIVVCMLLLGSRKKLELICVPAGWVVFSYFIFARLLHVRLPVGSLFSGIFS